MKNPALVSFDRFMELAIAAGHEDDHPFSPKGHVVQSTQLIYIKFVHLVAAALKEVGGQAINLMLTHIDDMAVEAGERFYVIDFKTPGATVDTMALYHSEKRKGMYYKYVSLIAKELSIAEEMPAQEKLNIVSRVLKQRREEAFNTQEPAAMHLNTTVKIIQEETADFKIGGELCWGIEN